MKTRFLPVVFATLLVLAGPALGQIRVGVAISATGPAAALGVPERNTVALMPAKIGGLNVEYIVLDDGSDTTNARRNVEKLISEHKVDAVIGTSTTPTTLAISEFAAKSQTPVISLGGALIIVEPMNDVRKWIFATPFNDPIVMGALGKHMVQSKVRSIAVVAFADAMGDNQTQSFLKVAREHQFQVVATEKFNPTDTSVTAQILKIMAAKPDAVIVLASGTPATLPTMALRERNYGGGIYHNNGVITNDFIRLGGKRVEGIVVAAGPVIVADDLPDNHPVKKVAVDYKTRYEAMYGRGTFSAFGGNAWDASLILQSAIPQALSRAKPGTVEFRAALRDAIEATKDLPATHGVINMSPTNHSGFSPDAPAFLTIKDGRWTLIR